jgi:hypothetical protein
MRKINNWEDINKDEVVEFDSIPAGPQICKILKVQDVEQKEYLKIEFDIKDGNYKDFFKQQFDRDTRNEKEWPNSGILYKSYKKTAERFFAAFITAVEKSNDGFHWNWDEQSLVGKTFVANFREEEYVGDGEIKSSMKCHETRSTQALRDDKIKIFELKSLTEKQLADAGLYEEAAKTNMKLQDEDDDLPF